jgi:hypothetical protein
MSSGWAFLGNYIGTVSRASLKSHQRYHATADHTLSERATMNLARKFIVPVFAAVAVLAGTSAAVAPTAAMAAVAQPVSAVHAAAASARSAPEAPALNWLYWATYNTVHACNVEGDHLIFVYAIQTFECRQYTAGSYFVYKLFVLLGHPPGS